MGPAPTERSLSTLADYRERALELIPAQSVAGVIGAPGSDVFETDERNRGGWSRLALVPHVLVDVRDRGTATTVLGQAVSSPVLLSPVGSHNRAHPEGEMATARAAERAGTILGLSTVSSYTIEEVAASSQAALWFQLYVFRQRSISAVLAERAVDAGYKAIVLTVDNPGTRSDERVFRSQRQQAEHEVFPNLRGVPGAEHIGTLQFHEGLDDSLSWADLEWVRSLTPLPLGGWCLSR